MSDKNLKHHSISPVSTRQRHAILDVLRGVALVGICLANFPEFALYTFQKKEVVEAMPTADTDAIIRFFQYFLIDGKFYTLFSLLFGIGFSIIISNFLAKNRNGLLLFYRRMIILIGIGVIHLLFLWAGDILILYALVGLFLPLFRNVSDKKLLLSTMLLLLLPIIVDSLIVLFDWHLSAPVIQATQYFHARAGITQENFPVWLVEKESYKDVLAFNLAGSFIRMQEFIESNRIFKVLGLFLLGLYIGRNQLYANLDKNKPLIKKVCFYGFLIGIPSSLIYAWDAVSGHPLGMIGTAVIYAISVVPMSFGYITAICLCYLAYPGRKIYSALAASGRMALTNYIMQSVFGMIIFYGIGFGLGAKVGLVYVELIALGVFLIQVAYSTLWLHYLQFGPLEWIWRMLTYGKWLKLTKTP